MKNQQYGHGHILRVHSGSKLGLVNSSCDLDIQGPRQGISFALNLSSQMKLESISPRSSSRSSVVFWFSNCPRDWYRANCALPFSSWVHGIHSVNQYSELLNKFSPTFFLFRLWRCKFGTLPDTCLVCSEARSTVAALSSLRYMFMECSLHMAHQPDLQPH